jgi:hypothetical protein
MLGLCNSQQTNTTPMGVLRSLRVSDSMTENSLGWTTLVATGMVPGVNLCHLCIPVDIE